MPRSRQPILTARQAPDAPPPLQIGKRRLSRAGALEPLWGRRKRVSTASGLLSLGFTLSCQLFILFAHICLDSFDGSITRGAQGLLSSRSLFDFLRSHFPPISKMPLLGYVAWVLAQAMFYTGLPGKLAHGPPTPSGLRLTYRINGLLSWFFTIGIWLAVFCIGGPEIAAAPAQHFATLIVSGNAYGLAVAVMALLKAYYLRAPNQDRRSSGMSKIELREFCLWVRTYLR